MPTRHHPFGSIRFVLAPLVGVLLCLTPSNAFVTLMGNDKDGLMQVTSGRLYTDRSHAFETSTRLHLNIGGWFGRRGDRKRQDGNNNSNNDRDAENLGGVAGIVDSMGDLKTAQRVGQLTDSLVKDLATTVVEGSALDGRVRVSFDGQQKPVGVTIDEAVLTDANVDATTLANALTSAMQDAHGKSIERMDEKMKSLYSELGLAAAA